MLRAYPVFEVHLVVSKAAKRVVAEESDLTLEQIRGLADVNHATDDIGASIASGSFRTEGMIVVPCSMKSVSEIAYSNTTNLLTRAADVRAWAMRSGSSAGSVQRAAATYSKAASRWLNAVASSGTSAMAPP